jgi:DNA-binding MarR family transcriptional regulator
MTAKNKTNTPAPADANSAWLAVVRAYNLCNAAMTSRLAALEVRVGEHEVLANLSLTPGITQQELAGRCFVAKSGISMLIGRMETDGLLRRESDIADGRIKRLFLSAAGARLARRTLAIQEEVVGEMARELSASELAALASVMRRVCLRLEHMG